MKKYQVALLVLLAVAAAITVGCGSSNSVPTFTKMAMSSNRTVTPATQLFTMNVDGSSVTPVQIGSSNFINSPSVNADLKTVVYASNSEVWSVNPSSGSPTQLTQNSANSNSSYSARISPNGQKIVYAVWSNSGANVWIMNVDGTGSANLTSTMPTGMASCYIASFSADSSKIVFACYGSSTYGLYTIHPDGTQLATVMTQSSSLDTPAFTPNGKQILFVTHGTPGVAQSSCFNHAGLSLNHQHPQPLVPSCGTQGIASVNLDGSNPTLIVPGSIWESLILNSNLYYSIYDSNLQKNQIFKSNLDGTGSTSVSDGTANDGFNMCTQC